MLDTAEVLSAIEVILYVDDDDTGSHHLDATPLHTVRLIGPKQSMGTYNTQCYRAAKGQIIVLVNDDMVMLVGSIVILLCPQVISIFCTAVVLWLLLICSTRLFSTVNVSSPGVIATTAMPPATPTTRC